MPSFGQRREMACTREDFRRWVGEILMAPAPTFDGGRMNLRPLGVPLAIVVSDLPPREVGLLRLRLLDVRFEFDVADAAQAENWVRVFDAHTQRGGG